MIWDPGTKRFYYLADDINGDNFLSLGFSKNASPNTAADWCKYNLDYGASDFPDYPKLGDTKDFTLIGVNVFTGNPFTGSDVLAVTKPAAGTACPDPASFGVTQQTDLQNANGAQAFTPVPANQTDTSGTGWIVARPAAIPAAGSDLPGRVQSDAQRDHGRGCDPEEGEVSAGHRLQGSGGGAAEGHYQDDRHVRHPQHPGRLGDRPSARHVHRPMDPAHGSRRRRSRSALV